jgi:hypothetical protein
MLFSNVLPIVIGFIWDVDANAFLKATPAAHEEHMSEQEVKTNLLSEVEGAFGEGTASSRLKELELLIKPMYAALPKNENGYLGHAIVRYALHRIFVQRHGWFVKGLHETKQDRNPNSTSGILNELVPAYVQGLFEERLGDRGLGLHELAVLAATVEHLVHKEAIKRLGIAFRMHKHLQTSAISGEEADKVLETYMAAYILGEDLALLTRSEALSLPEQMPEIFEAWNATKVWAREMRQNVTDAEATGEQKASGVFDFALAARVAERIGEQYGKFQNKACTDIRDSLTAIAEPGTGRVRLSDFYRPALDGGAWHFSESVNYLRQLGALDESDAGKPRVIIPNYISSPSNCVASSAFYSVCCMDECEGLLGSIEQNLAASEGRPNQILALVNNMLPASEARQVSSTLQNRLYDISEEHAGEVPLHGRLFAQWMHHVFPLECPYPHLSGTLNPLTPVEWLAAVGEDVVASDEEMANHVNAHTEPDQVDISTVPWTPEEELLVVRPVKIPQTLPENTTLRNMLLFLCVLTIGYSMVRSSTSLLSGSRTTKVINHQKYLV